ncbi:MAG: Shedu anti-phage system protein SduA domain-containing protein [Thainema sp.]
MLRKAQSWKKKYPADRPPEPYWVNSTEIENSTIDEFISLVNNANCGESEIDRYLNSNKEILSYIMPILNTGNHGIWIIPQLNIRPSTHISKGMKPDYIVGGCNSDGYLWSVVELKSPNQNIFSEENTKIGLNKVVNQGVCQLIEYMDYCSEAQSYLRDTLKLNEFREPSGILIVGREEEFDGNDNKRKRDLKAAINRLYGNRLQIRTYDALIRSIEARRSSSELNSIQR